MFDLLSAWANFRVVPLYSCICWITFDNKKEFSIFILVGYTPLPFLFLFSEIMKFILSLIIGVKWETYLYINWLPNQLQWLFIFTNPSILMIKTDKYLIFRWPIQQLSFRWPFADSALSRWLNMWVSVVFPIPIYERHSIPSIP